VRGAGYGVTSGYRRHVSGDQEIIRFSRSDIDAIVEAMDSLQRAEAGGWINIGPWLSDDVMAEVPQRSGLGAWFSGLGPYVPMATWIPGLTTGRRPTPAQVGIEHGTGPNALARLSEAGHPMPADWRRRQDHGKHGIVAELPEGVDLGEVVVWLIEAITLLSEYVSPGNRWRAVIHRPG